MTWEPWEVCAKYKGRHVSLKKYDTLREEKWKDLARMQIKHSGKREADYNYVKQGGDEPTPSENDGFRKDLPPCLNPEN